MGDYERFIDIVHNNLAQKEYDELKKQRILNLIRDKYKDSPIFFAKKDADSIQPLFLDTPNCFGPKDDGFPEIDNLPRENRTEVLRQIYTTCPPFSAKERIDALNEKGLYGRTALHDAVMLSDRQNISRLLHEGANPYVTDNNGHTPLMLARFDGHLEIAAFLQDLGVER